MSLQQNQIDQLADWLTEAEKTIEKQDTIGSDLDAVKAQVEEHKVTGDINKKIKQKYLLTTAPPKGVFSAILHTH